MSSSESGGRPRQRIERVRGARRAKLTPAPGTSLEPDAEGAAPPGATPAAASGATPPSTAAAGPNDERMLRDVPPHY